MNTTSVSGYVATLLLAATVIACSEEKNPQPTPTAPGQFVDKPLGLGNIMADTLATVKYQGGSFGSFYELNPAKLPFATRSFQPPNPERKAPESWFRIR